jgi:hypothetical protein
VNGLGTLRRVSASERAITSALVIAAIAAWFAVAFVLAFVSPEGNAAGQLLGAAVFGAAVGLTAWPLLWSMRRGQPGTLAKSGRRSFLAGGAVSLLVILRAIDVVSPVVIVAVIAGAVVIELAVSLRR